MFEWEKSKTKENQSKNGIPFADTFAVFNDPNAVALEDIEHGEQRYITIGMDSFGRILEVVYTWIGESIRIISESKAVRYEGKQYEGEI